MVLVKGVRRCQFKKKWCNESEERFCKYSQSFVYLTVNLNRFLCKDMIDAKIHDKP